MKIEDRIEERFKRLEARDDRLISMSVDDVLYAYQHDRPSLVRILELRESIIRARARGDA